MSITMQADLGSNITTLTATGQVTANDLLAGLQEFYSRTPTELALCDLSNADLDSFSRADVERLVGATKRLASVRDRPRTAIVAKGDLGFGLARMYEILGEAKGHPASMRVFRARDEAIQWLRERT